jgi:NAD(P)H-dependent FMN reductase
MFSVDHNGETGVTIICKFHLFFLFYAGDDPLNSLPATGTNNRAGKIKASGQVGKPKGAAGVISCMNERYAIISGTNRTGSKTLRVANQYKNLLGGLNISAPVISLETLDVTHRHPGYKQVENELLIPADKIIFIAPEYNGSIPGVLKTMLDISDYKKVWWGKKALLVGISTGRSGNVRGLDHLTSILNFMKVVVHPNKLPISVVDKLMQTDDFIDDPQTITAIQQQLKEFISF